MYLYTKKDNIFKRNKIYHFSEADFNSIFSNFSWGKNFKKIETKIKPLMWYKLNDVFNSFYVE